MAVERLHDTVSRLKFLWAEMRHPFSYHRPALIRRGFYSHRAWLYPTDPKLDDGYISDLAFKIHAGELNPTEVKRRLRDKVELSRALIDSNSGVTTPRDLAYVHNGRVKAIARDKGYGVVLKPAAESRGRGISFHTDLDNAIRDCPGDGHFLIQERVCPHQYARDIYSGSLNTIRVMVLRLAQNREPRIFAMVHRFGTDESAPVDAFSAGGIAARIDVRTGAMTHAVRRPERKARTTFDSHPDSGAQITGVRVPSIDEVSNLAYKAMEQFPSANYVGWDIAVSASGPVLIEGNASNPSLALLQAHGPLPHGSVVRSFYTERGITARLRKQQ
jgi:hypothetical protein